MKSATGEVNLTIIVIIAIGAILIFVSVFLPKIINKVNDSWEDSDYTKTTIKIQ